MELKWNGERSNGFWALAWPIVWITEMWMMDSIVDWIKRIAFFAIGAYLAANYPLMEIKLALILFALYILGVLSNLLFELDVLFANYAAKDLWFDFVVEWLREFVYSAAYGFAIVQLIIR